MFVDYSQADLGMCESASLGEVGALPIWRLDWNKIGFWASVPWPCSPPTGVGLSVGVQTMTLYSCTEFTNPLALRRRWRS